MSQRGLFWPTIAQAESYSNTSPFNQHLTRRLSGQVRRRDSYTRPALFYLQRLNRTMPSSSSSKVMPMGVKGEYMDAAVKSALEGIYGKEGGPFGAAIVRNGNVVTVAHNTVLKFQDCTHHAEMNCIRDACHLLETHDLSDCDLYTTCEPCPMCWGACNWARLNRLVIGVDRKTASEFGFDDEFFYQELDLPKDERRVKHLDGIMHAEISEIFKSSPTYKRRLLSGGGMMAKIYEKMFSEEVESHLLESDGIPLALNEFMRIAIDTAMEGAAAGGSKEREPFGAVVVQNGTVLAKTHNTVIRDHDPTATAEINAIRETCGTLKTHNLDGCEMYTTAEPDPMSLGAIYWSRISKIHVGVSQKLAASFGFEDGLLHYRELSESRDNRVISIVEDVQFNECESVFRQWQELGGHVY